MSQYPPDPNLPQHPEWPFAPPTWQGEPPPQPPPPRLRGMTVIAWIVIVVAALFLALQSNLAGPAPVSGEPDTMGLVILEIQGKYLVGASEQASGQGTALYDQSAELLGVGTLDQRLRFIVLAGELAGRAEAGEQVTRLEEDLASANVQVRSEQQKALDILQRLYGHDAAAVVDSDEVWLAAVAQLEADEQQLLVDELGWFGELALYPPPAEATAAAQRSLVLAPALRLFWVLVLGIMLGILVGLAGLVGLIVLFVLALTRRLRSGMDIPFIHHGIYAETFAVWILVFFASLTVCGLLVQLPAVQGHEMFIMFVGFMLSLAALLWPKLRGAQWWEVRRDIGWTVGRAPAAEPFLGIAGYAMALPLLAIGVLITFVLITIQGQFHTISTEPFQPMGGPSHPIIGELAGGSIWAAVQVLLLAAVAAPIVEETMFRGVLYRSLRDGTARLGTALSILFSAAVNALIFAMIHPQGWVAIPALGALAVAFCLMREWRGTVLPSMLMHGLNNGLVMGFVIIALQR